MRRSLPVRGDPRTWCLMVKDGKILMRIGLLFRVPIVAFSINAAIATKKNTTIVFAFQPKVDFAKLDFQKESN